MKQIPIHTKQVDVQKVGYSDFRLQPMYLLFTSLFFLTWPIFGKYSALLIVSVPAFMIALKVAQLEQIDTAGEAARWQAISKIYIDIAMRDEIAERESTALRARLAAQAKAISNSPEQKRSPQMQTTTIFQPNLSQT